MKGKRKIYFPIFSFSQKPYEKQAVKRKSAINTENIPLYKKRKYTSPATPFGNEIFLSQHIYPKAEKILKADIIVMHNLSLSIHFTLFLTYTTKYAEIIPKANTSK